VSDPSSVDSLLIQCPEFILNHLHMRLGGFMLIIVLKLRLFSVGAIVSNHIVNNRPHADNALFK